MPELNTTGVEKTGQQINQVGYSLGAGTQRLDRVLPASYDTYRELRKQATVALARGLAVAPIAMSSWSVETEGGDVPDE